MCVMFQVFLLPRTPHMRPGAATRATLVSDCRTPQVITWPVCTTTTITMATTRWRRCYRTRLSIRQVCTVAPLPGAACTPCPCERDSRRGQQQQLPPPLARVPCRSNPLRAVVHAPVLPSTPPMPLSVSSRLNLIQLTTIAVAVITHSLLPLYVC